jgi:hypothetical protein
MTALVWVALGRRRISINMDTPSFPAILFFIFAILVNRIV